MADFMGSMVNGGMAFVVLAGVVSAGLLVHVHAAEGSSSPVRVDLRSPFRSAKGLLVGLAVRILGVSLGAVRSTLEQLYEASAEVGEWFFSRTNPGAQDRFRSGF
jgi:ABC-type transporter Mla subunit MlaD